MVPGSGSFAVTVVTVLVFSGIETEAVSPPPLDVIAGGVSGDQDPLTGGDVVAEQTVGKAEQLDVSQAVSSIRGAAAKVAECRFHQPLCSEFVSYARDGVVRVIARIVRDRTAEQNPTG